MNFFLANFQEIKRDHSLREVTFQRSATNRAQEINWKLKLVRGAKKQSIPWSVRTTELTVTRYNTICD